MKRVPRLFAFTSIRALTLLVSVAACLAVAGCEDDPHRVNESCKDCHPYARASTPDLLMENFVRAFNERNYEEYESMLHDEFVFYFAPDEVDEIGQGESWFREDDLQSTENMFNGGTGRRPDGSVQAPVQSIILELVPESAEGWTDQVHADFAGTLMRRYTVEMDVTYNDGNVDEVTGVQEFYVADVEITTLEGPQTIYRLKFWRDLGKSTKGTRSHSFSQVKAQF